MEKPKKQKQKQTTSNPKTFSRCRSLSDSSILKPVHLLNNSPRHLMLSLQHKRSPSEFGFCGWKIRTNDLAVEEILRDRQEAIRTGKLKGRRLFEDPDGVSICSYDYDDDNVGNTENKSSSCLSSGSGFFVCDKCMEKEVVAVEGEKGVVFEGIKEEEKEIRVDKFKGWLAIGLSVCVIGVIAVWGFCSYGDDDDQVMFLVPT